MKQLLLVSCSLLFTAWLNAQDFILNPSRHQSDTIEAGGFRAFRVEITPPDSTDITLKWQRVANTLDDNNWSFSLCDYPSCYPGIPSTGQMGTVTAAQMQNGTAPFFQVAIATHDSAAVGMASIYVYDANDFSRGDTVSFLLVTIEEPEDTTTGVANLAVSAIGVYPNPTHGQLTLTGAALESIIVYDMRGSVVYNRNVNFTQRETLDLGTLTPGVYTLSVKSAKGVHTERLIRQ